MLNNEGLNNKGFSNTECDNNIRIGTKTYESWQQQRISLRLLSVLVFTLALFSLFACKETPLIDPNLASGIEDDSDNIEVSNLKTETLQVLTDLPPIAQQALSEAYFKEKNIRIGWLDINANTDTTLINMDIKATVSEPVLIEPNEPEPINLTDTMTAEEALINGVPLPEAISTHTDDTTNNTVINAANSATTQVNTITSANAPSNVIVEAGQAVVMNDNVATNTIHTANDANNIIANSNNPNAVNAQNSTEVDSEEEIVISMKDHYHLPNELDVLLLHSVYDMQKLAHHNQLQPIASQILLDRISQTYHDPDGYWVGLSMYGRSIVYNKDKVNADKLVNYAKLEDEIWRNRLCLTDFRYPDNQAILQIMKTHRGLHKTRELLTGWQLNLAGNANNTMQNIEVSTSIDANASASQQNSIPTSNDAIGHTSDAVEVHTDAIEPSQPLNGSQQPPAPLTPYVQPTQQQLNELYYKNDTSVLDAIHSGQCDVGIVNSDSLMWYISEHPDTPVRLTWANQINHGTVTNAISTGIAKQSDDTAKALDFIEWLASDRGQAVLAFYSKTYPIASISDPNINMQVVRPQWTQFKADTAPLTEMFEMLKEQETGH